MLLGSAVTDVCDHASLSGRGDAQAKRIKLNAGLLHRAVETSSGKQQTETHTPDSDFPKNAVFSQRGFPGREAFALCGFSFLLRILG